MFEPAQKFENNAISKQNYILKLIILFSVNLCYAYFVQKKP